MQKEKRIEIYRELSAYGMLASLREEVSRKRLDKRVPSRDTVWRAFNLEDGELTEYHTLIIRVAEKMLAKHLSEVGSI